MAGTDRTKVPLPSGSGPVMILVEPQLGMNIGACARAMLNCGLGDMRIVAPRDGWPNPEAVANASGADAVLAAADLSDDLPTAIGDLTHVYATTARPRGMVKPVMTPRAAAEDMRRRIALGETVGVLFGRERTGLENEDVARADTVITVPLNPSFSSLNLAQAVLLVAYEWFTAGDVTAPMERPTGTSEPATMAAFDNLFDHLIAALDASGRFFTSPPHRPSITRNLRTLFLRADMTDQEVRTFHGVIAALAGAVKWKRDPGPDDGRDES